MIHMRSHNDDLVARLIPRWQPAESNTQTLNGREAELEFTRAIAAYAGVAIRF
jgi:hypothetical protein